MKNNIKEFISKLDTGDLLLFHSKSFIGKLIQCCTKSEYCHIGMILKDPIYLDKNLKGIYLWQSGRDNFPDAEDHKVFYGVQITPIEDILKEYSINEIFVRKLQLEKILNINQLIEIHHQIYHHEYDLNIIDWIKADVYQLQVSENDKRPLNNKIKTKKSFWCSALIGYIFYKMEWMNQNIKWFLLSPQDWSSSEKVKLPLINCELTDDTPLNQI